MEEAAEASSSIGEAEEAVLLRISRCARLTTRDHHRATSPTRPAGVSNHCHLDSFSTDTVFLFIPSVKEEDKVAVKIRGLPYQVRYEEIADFFRDHRYIEKSAILGVGADGRKNGFGSILFEDQETAQIAAKELDGNYIGERYVEISVISYGDYLRFNGP